ncbi:aminotransferase [Choiromyces venosus 120613-1]|uniref:Aminotransferase n=1 Tax=Choiromyces venosus 120613-1 TaxID=1336337 RepID=A0A3N4K4H8_9PEZI|nr:aminotransferase [Choiromyces venosus 120613-1]
MTLPVYRDPNTIKEPATSSVFHHDLLTPPFATTSSAGHYLTLQNGRKIYDSTGGAAVACLGHGNERVKKAMIEQIDSAAYVHSLVYAVPATEELAKELILGTEGKMSHAYLVCSGSEATEAALKLARQYFLELPTPQPARVHYISRHQSYHGITLGALGVSGHASRRGPFEPMFAQNSSRVSPCYAYRDMKDGETTEQYVVRLAKELDDEFVRVGPEKVCAFIAEPIVGATLGCVPAVEGYFKAMQEICHKYGALLILDEVMSGMGRSGTLHAWQQEGVVPDIQMIGKGLGGGYAPIAGLLINPRVVDVLRNGSGTFIHGHTYQAHPVSCAAALEVQRIVREQSLVSNVARMGKYLSNLLKSKLGDHPYVGDIRGKGLFWGLEFVENKTTKEPFDPKLGVSMRVFQKGMDTGMSFYPGNGTADGVKGDHVLIAPMYDVTEEDCDFIVGKVLGVIEAVFEEIDTERGVSMGNPS